MNEVQEGVPEVAEVAEVLERRYTLEDVVGAKKVSDGGILPRFL